MRNVGSNHTNYLSDFSSVRSVFLAYIIIYFRKQTLQYRFPTHATSFDCRTQYLLIGRFTDPGFMGHSFPSTLSSQRTPDDYTNLITMLWGPDSTQAVCGER
jgi:hypothetical protein